jgi:hypothetical protein
MSLTTADPWVALNRYRIKVDFRARRRRVFRSRGVERRSRRSAGRGRRGRAWMREGRPADRPDRVSG